ncbi:tRNA guanosine(34) transglycosylase Tgt [Candidatus Wolfebacteria bacterium]|nr:tRNA guanosine(34) transglycosylase Tgt [Candidatus Wolfebacteria bacterium]
MEFEIIKKSKKSRARLGILKTSHGEIETPAFVPVATQAVIKTLDTKEVLETKSQLLITNTFHLHLKPGEDLIKKSGGLHKFMNWPRPLMTDSGGFQVFSLGFGRDLGVGKVMKFLPSKNTGDTVGSHSKPKSVKIREDGVYFNSPVDGQKIFLGPQESIRIQQSLGGDIIFAFDECTPPFPSREYAMKALKRTHRWAVECLKTFSHKSLVNSHQSLFGIIQGSHFEDLRIESARFINSLGFDGFGIGGDLGEKGNMKKILNWTLPHLDENKPRHLLGIGHPEDILNIIKWGIDTFDCTIPTHYARHGSAFTSAGRLDLNKSVHLKDRDPLDPKCACPTCLNYRRNYISHLIRAKEMTGMKLLTIHNLFFFNNFVAQIREGIRKGKV